MILKIWAYLSGLATGFAIGAIFSEGIFDYLFQFLKVG